MFLQRKTSLQTVPDVVIATLKASHYRGRAQCPRPFGGSIEAVRLILISGRQ